MKYSLRVVENYRVLLSENRFYALSGEGGEWLPPHSCTDVSSAVGNLCGEVEWKRVSLDETDVAFFARWGVRGEVFGVADYTEADAFDVGVDAPLGEEGFPLGRSNISWARWIQHAPQPRAWAALRRLPITSEPS